MPPPMPLALRHRLAAFGLALCGVLPMASLITSAAAANPAAPASLSAVDEPHAVRDMAYGEFLFDFYQNRAFSALVQALIARHKTSLPNNAAQVDILSGPLYLRYGMLNEAERLFTDLLSTTTATERRHHIWFILAEIYYKKGRYQKSLDIMSTHIAKPAPELADKMELLAALNHLLLNNNERALNHLSNIQNTAVWGPYALFNTAISFARLEQPEQAEYYFIRILRLKSDDPLLPVLKERALLALGKQYLSYQRWPEARRAFESIRLTSPVANHALLGLGWAYANGADLIGALAPWLELQKRHHADPAVHEAFLNVPYVYEQLAALQSALNGYRVAEQHFTQAQAALDQTRQDIASEAWITALTPSNPLSHNPMAPVEAFNLPVDDASHYFYRFFASHSFSESYRRYRDLQNLLQNLIDWQQRLPIYTEVVASDQQHLQHIAPFAAQTLDSARKLLGDSQQRLAQINHKLGDAINNDNGLATANDTELALQQRLQRVAEKLARLPSTPGHDSLRERFRILQGVLTWDLQHTAIERRWELRKDSAYVNTQLSAIEQRLESTLLAYESKQQRYQGFDARISELEQRLSALQTATREQMTAQQSLLRQQANRLLDQHQAHLQSLRAAARLSIARLQDKAYVDSTRRGDTPVSTSVSAPVSTSTPSQPQTIQPAAQPPRIKRETLDIEAIRKHRESLFPTPPNAIPSNEIPPNGS